VGPVAALALAVGLVLGLTGPSLWRLRRASRSADELEDRFWSGGALSGLASDLGARPSHPMAAVFLAGWREHEAGGTGEAMLSVMEVHAAREVARLRVVGPVLLLIALAAPLPALVIALTDLPGRQTAALGGAFVAVVAALAFVAVKAVVSAFANRLVWFGREFAVIASRQSQMHEQPATRRAA
jgi:biopolymer transport protein TolQ